MGGAPPPPQDFAPQGRKNRKNSAFSGRILEVWSPEDQSPSRGGGGDSATTHLGVLGVGTGLPTPITDRFPGGGGSGNQPGRRSESTGLISPELRREHSEGTQCWLSDDGANMDSHSGRRR